MLICRPSSWRLRLDASNRLAATCVQVNGIAMRFVEPYCAPKDLQQPLMTLSAGCAVGTLGSNL